VLGGQGNDRNVGRTLWGSGGSARLDSRDRGEGWKKKKTIGIYKSTAPLLDGKNHSKKKKPGVKR